MTEIPALTHELLEGAPRSQPERRRLPPRLPAGARRVEAVATDPSGKPMWTAAFRVP